MHLDVIKCCTRFFLARTFVCIAMRLGGKAVVTAITSSQLSNDNDDESIRFVIVGGSTLYAAVLSFRILKFGGKSIVTEIASSCPVMIVIISLFNLKLSV